MPCLRQYPTVSGKQEQKMRIKPKIEFEFLQQEEYEVIAVNSSAIEFYLVQNDKKGFEWYES